MQLIAISPPGLVANEPALANNMMAAGLARFHVRKPDWNRAAVTQYLRSINPTYHPRLVLHSHHELVQEFGLGGAHLTAAARSSGRILRLLPQQTLSTSFHTLSEIRQHRRRYSYVFLSPIFDSLSKENYSAAFALSDLAEALRRLRQRTGYAPSVVALGGVDAPRLPLLRDAGFAGAAVLGAIWQAPDPVEASRQLHLVLAQ